MLKPLAVKQMQQEVVEHKIALNFFFFFFEMWSTKAVSHPASDQKREGEGTKKHSANRNRKHT